MRVLIALVLGLAAACAGPTDPVAAKSKIDPDTRAWWSITGDLASDAMEGRDTGSPGHARAVAYVIDRFERAGLQPAGDNGGWTQTLPLREVRVEKEGTSFLLRPKTGAAAELRFLHEITVRPVNGLPPSLDAPIGFRGYCSPAELGQDMAGKIAVCFAARRQGLPTAAERLAAATAAGVAGLINVDDPGYSLEPSRWPDPYARSISFDDTPEPPVSPPALPVMRLKADALKTLIRGAGRDADGILAAGSAGQPLESFDVPGQLKATFQVSTRKLNSDNVLAMLPGTDQGLIRREVVLVSAHLDGYGFGEPIDGDALYNGAFDDAAYVATLIRLAERQAGKGFRRGVLFAVYTGEEKGLLGSTWFSRNLTIDKASIAAVINLDQLRPLFPLKILTMHAISDTSLAENVRRVAAGMGIEVRPDLEPERNLNQRTDHWPFLRMGVPATNFVFGYDPGTEAERRYREWYQVRYHRPQDDMTQPIDMQAAADMNTFFYRLVEDVANADARPIFAAGSPFAPK